MENKFQNLNRAAYITAILVAIVALISLFVFLQLSEVVSPFFLAICLALVLGLATFLFSRYAIRKYVYNKVKLIFKIIHEIKTGTEKREEKIAQSGNLSLVETEVKQWASAKKSEIDELKAREEFRREFIGNVSHELKTPIFNIQGYILTLIDGGLDDPDINMKYLKRAGKSVDRLINLVQDMDTLNKLESGVLEVVKNPFNVVSLVSDVIDSLEDYAKKAEVKMYGNTRKKSDEMMVLADASRIEQVLINLATNAIKYGRKGGRVDFSFFDLEDRILIEVSDDGVGISDSDVSRVFERFYRVDKSRTRDAGGSGLGLSIVKHIIDAHQESINVQSKLGTGSTFSFTLQKA